MVAELGVLDRINKVAKLVCSLTNHFLTLLLPY